MSISKPAAGVPVTIGLTGSVRLCRLVKTGIVTRGRVGGVTSTGLSGVAELVDRHQLDVLVDVDAASTG